MKIAQICSACSRKCEGKTGIIKIFCEAEKDSELGETTRDVTSEDNKRGYKSVVTKERRERAELRGSEGETSGTYATRSGKTHGIGHG